MRFYRTYVLIILCICSGMPLAAQEALVSDSAVIYPFKGRIEYRISYKGVGVKALRPFLPDSMVLHVGDSALRMQYIGGKADSLLQDVLWYSNTETFWVLDPGGQVALEAGEGYRMPAYKFRKQSEKRILLGHACTGHVATTSAENLSFWVFDSLYVHTRPVDSTSRYRPPFLAAAPHALPLQMIHKRNGILSTTTAENVEAGLPPADLFRIPEAYVRKHFDARAIRHPAITNNKKGSD